jgi:uncharacterized membrane protein
MILSTLGAAHLTSAFVALALGAVIVLERKGTSSHRMMGAGYVLAIALVNLTALGLYRLTGHFGPFHLLALVSLATVVWGMLAVLQRREGWLHSHYYSMAWSYIGLLAAACAEGVLRIPLLAVLINTSTQAIGLGVAIAVLFTILGALVVPRLQARAFASLE